MEEKKSGLSVASLILGIVGLVLCGIGFIPSLLGLIFGIVSKAKKKKGPAVAGIIISAIGLVIQTIATIAIIILLITFGISGVVGVLSTHNNNQNGGYSTGLIDPDDNGGYSTGLIVPDSVEDGYLYPDFENDYIRLFSNADGTTRIELDNTFSKSQQFTAYGCTIDQIYSATNEFRKMDSKAPISEELFYEILTVTLCDTQYFEAEDEDTYTMTEVYTALAAQATASALDLCPDAHVKYAEHDSNSVYYIYLDNDMVLRFNTIYDSSFSEYPYYVIYDVNGTEISNRYSIENVAVYMMAVEQASLY